MSSLSEETISKLADALVPEVISFIEDDFPRLNEFLMEVIGDAVCDKENFNTTITKFHGI